MNNPFSGSTPDLINSITLNDLDNMTRVKVIPNKVNHFSIFYNDYILPNAFMLFMLFCIAVFSYFMYKYKYLIQKPKRKPNRDNDNDFLLNVDIENI
jgi:hypothetical protein